MYFLLSVLTGYVVLTYVHSDFIYPKPQHSPRDAFRNKIRHAIQGNSAYVADQMEFLSENKFDCTKCSRKQVSIFVGRLTRNPELLEKQMDLMDKLWGVDSIVF